MPDIDPLGEFKSAVTAYQASRQAFVEAEDLARSSAIPREQHHRWRKAYEDRLLASEGLWVSGMAGLFDLLTTNYKAQAELAKEQDKTASRMAFWTMALVIVTCVLIVVTAYIGLKPARPMELRLISTPPSLLRASRHDLSKTCGGAGGVMSTCPCKPTTPTYLMNSGSA